MKLIKAAKKFIEDRVRYWYVGIGSFIALIFASNGIMPLFLDPWICSIISIVLVVLTTTYIHIIVSCSLKAYKEKTDNRDDTIKTKFEALENQINILENNTSLVIRNAVMDLQKLIEDTENQTTESIIDIIKSARDELNAEILSKTDEIIVTINSGFENQNSNFIEISDNLEAKTEKINEQIIGTEDTIIEFIKTSNKERICAEEEFGRILTDGFDNQGKQISATGEMLAGSLSAAKSEIGSEIDKIAECISNESSVMSELFSKQAEQITENTDSIKSEIAETAEKYTNTLASVSDKICADMANNKLSSERKFGEINEAVVNNADALRSLIAEASSNFESKATAVDHSLSELTNAVDSNCTSIIQCIKTTNENALSCIETNIVSSSKKNEECVAAALDIIRAGLSDVKKSSESKLDKLEVNQKTSEERITATVLERIDLSSEKNKDWFAEVRGNIFDSSESIANSIRTESDNISAISNQIGSLQNKTEVSFEKVEAVICDCDKAGKAQLETAVDKLIGYSENKYSESEKKIADFKSEVYICADRISEALSDKSAETKASVTALEASINNCTEELRRHDASTAEAYEKRANDIIEHYEEKSSSIVNALNVFENAARTSVNSIISELRNYSISIQNSDLENTSKILESISSVGRGSDSIISAVNNVQKEINELLIRVLDNQTNDSRKSDSGFNSLSEHLKELSEGLNVQIDSIRHEINESRRLTEQTVQKVDSLSADASSFNSDTVKIISEYSSAATLRQSDIFNRLDNLENQLSNIASLSDVVKSLSVSQNANRSGNSDIAKSQASLPDSSKRNPDRVEKINDAENGITLYNHYKNDILVSSEMKKNGTLTYDVEYSQNGAVSSSRNYSEKGEILTELLFYPNGQVKTRKELLRTNGKAKTVISNFDEKGNKK